MNEEVMAEFKKQIENGKWVFLEDIGVYGWQKFMEPPCGFCLGERLILLSPGRTSYGVNYRAHTIDNWGGREFGCDLKSAIEWLKGAEKLWLTPNIWTTNGPNHERLEEELAELRPKETEQIKNIYILGASQGEYSDRSDWSICAFESEEEAEKIRIKLKKVLAQCREKKTSAEKELPRPANHSIEAYKEHGQYRWELMTSIEKEFFDNNPTLQNYDLNDLLQRTSSSSDMLYLDVISIPLHKKEES